jgi:hypothetical protein
VDYAGNWSNTAAHAGPFRIDATAPTGSLRINNGADYVNGVAVILELSATDDGSDVAQMQVKHAGVEYDWEAYSTAKSFELAAGGGTKEVSVRYQDKVGDISEWYADTIILDTAPPNSTVSTLPVSQTVVSFVVAWHGEDPTPGSGIGTYDVQYRVGHSGEWVNWLVDIVQTSDTFGPAVPTSLESGQTYFFRCRARDNPGNVEPYPGGDGDTWTTVYIRRVFLPLIRKNSQVRRSRRTMAGSPRTSGVLPEDKIQRPRLSLLHLQA